MKNTQVFILLVILTSITNCSQEDNPSGPYEEPEDEYIPAFSFEKSAEIQFPFRNMNNIASGDLNNDGQPDIVAVTQEVAVLGILEASPQNTFSTVLDTMDVINQCCYSKVVLNDLDQDGYPEAVVTDGSTSGGIHILKNYQKGRFHYQETIGLLSASAVKEIIKEDFSGDNIPDIAINGNFGRTSIFINNGTGMLSDEIQIVNPDNGMYTYMGLTAGDFDNNHTMDLAHVSENGIFISLLTQNSDDLIQTQTEIPINNFSRSIAATDINNDGNLDIITSHHLLINAGDGQNFEITPITDVENPSAVTAADIDQDGFVDIILADTEERMIHLLKNNGDLSFTLDHKLPLEEDLRVGGSTAMPYTILTDDLNQDGFPDITVSSYYSSKVFIYINTSNL